MHVLCFKELLTDCEENYQANKTHSFDLISDALKELKL